MLVVRESSRYWSEREDSEKQTTLNSLSLLLHSLTYRLAEMDSVASWKNAGAGVRPSPSLSCFPSLSPPLSISTSPLTLLRLL